MKRGIGEKGDGGDPGDSELFASAFGEHGADPSLLVPWDARAVEVGAKRLAPRRGMERLQALWSRDKYFQHLQKVLGRLEKYFEFASVPADRDVIRQDEYANFMIVLLDGQIVVDRRQPWGEQVRLAEVRPGDVLGEMSLLDGGTRFSVCTTLTDCEIAILHAEAMDEMMNGEPQLAGALVTLLARKLSMRLRAVGARLSDQRR
ncbi:MAG TPA: Crp/Fnr family transcriptional regulator [Ramlibacter sp.]|uniref:Crp/Fnr family transcriptional regulator n=1 Tax=Ramlibacter sp. TaxID=1917967 RepID=UPI002B8A703F|nr:Crp/Fnr family transcriptional regulator [Ramlibacter sp.]HVZ43928.1 Crp/Fnr family transcriptional regulator [Ramlibacter sp.]